MNEANTRDLSAYRIEKAKELLGQADALLKMASYDGSINRSYYAIFSAIRALLALVRLDSQKHTGVIGFFDRYFVKTGICEKSLSQIVHTAFEARQISDYQDFYRPTAEQAQLQFENAQRLLRTVEETCVLLLEHKIPYPEIVER
ncbi:putative toxin-antitoxin system, antitoxin component [Candidatus Vecturithrix granuli]|uniref:Putative toxin-antitoxin system, antitoxin component n=1 Tax=Vecturithrix granuli TaxID=1499967 RepID=A0A081C5K3_VECG1|nr:putative toxin-antitoxin system, antitoxin component [Candidatus Vecturithrix granuli]